MSAAQRAGPVHRARSPSIRPKHAQKLAVFDRAVPAAAVCRAPRRTSGILEMVQPYRVARPSRVAAWLLLRAGMAIGGLGKNRPDAYKPDDQGLDPGTSLLRRRHCARCARRAPRSSWTARRRCNRLGRHMADADHRVADPAPHGEPAVSPTRCEVSRVARAPLRSHRDARFGARRGRGGSGSPGRGGPSDPAATQRPAHLLVQPCAAPVLPQLEEHAGPVPRSPVASCHLASRLRALHRTIPMALRGRSCPRGRRRGRPPRHVRQDTSDRPIRLHLRGDESASSPSTRSRSRSRPWRLVSV